MSVMGSTYKLHEKRTKNKQRTEGRGELKSLTSSERKRQIHLLNLSHKRAFTKNINIKMH